jgi:hypothetical protein
MSAFCSGIVAKLFLVAAGLLAGGAQAPMHVRHAGIAPAVTVVSLAAPADTTGAARAPRGGTSATPGKAAAPQKQTKITISDEGIQIESEGTEKVTLGVDEKTRGRISVKGLESLKNLPESLDVIFGEDENNRYYNVRGSDVVQFGKRIIIGPHDLVNGDVVSIASDITVEGKVMGDVAAILGSVRLGPNAIVNGEVVSILGGLDRADGAVVRGETAIIGHGRHPHGMTLPLGPFGEGLFGAGAKVATFIIFVLLMLIVIYFLSRRMTNAASYAGSSFLKSFGAGLLVALAGSVLILILAIILAITIVGIPVALLLVLSFVALFLLGYIVAAIAIGGFVSRKFNIGGESVYVHGLIGLFLLAILGIVASFMFFNPLMGPFRAMLRVAGGLLNFVAVLTGVGAFLLTKGGSSAVKQTPANAENAGSCDGLGL